MEAYKVWADLSIKGNAHKKLEDFAKLSKKAAKSINDLNKIMMPFNKHLSNMAFNLVELNPQLSKLSTTFIRLSTNANSSKKSLNDFNAGLSTASNHTDRLIKKSNKLARSLGNVGSSAAVSGAHLGRIKGNGDGIGKEAIGLGLMGTMAGRFVPYVAAYEAAREALNFGKSSFQSSSKFESQIGQLETRGFQPNQIADIKKFAMSQNIPGVSYNDMLTAYSNALMATQDPSQAKFLAPLLAKGQFAANQLYHGMTNKQQEELIRFAEYRGKGNAAKTSENLGVGLQMMALSGGTIRPSDLAQFQRYGGAAVSNLTNQSLLAMEPILQLRGGAKSGTALQTLSLQFSKGQMGKYQALDLQSLGMLGNVELDKNGRPIGSKYGAFKYGKQLHTDAFGFLMKTYLPALKKQGVTDPQKIEDKIMFDFGRTSGEILQSMYENSDKILRVLVAQGKLVPGTEMYNIAIKKPGGAQGRLMAAWENLKTSFGEFESPAIITGMNALAAFLEKITALFNDFNQARGDIKNFLLKSDNDPTADMVRKAYSQGWGKIKEYFSSLKVVLNDRVVGQVMSDHLAKSSNVGGVSHGMSNTNLTSSMPPVTLNSLGTGYTG